MRKNLPVSHHEYVLEEGRPIVSMTDLKGLITFVNPYFIEVSGFDEEELLGAPHNIVRHPDMPPAAFADLWNSMKNGDIWSAMVRNRRKNGDHYWVLANVTPIRENGGIVGYMSVRTKPSRQQIESAASAYAQIRDNPHAGLTVKNGRLAKTGIAGWFARLRDISLTTRLSGITGLQIACFAAVALGANLSPGGMAGSNLAFWAAAIALTGIALAIYLWHSLRKTVIQPLRQALELSSALAGGDLTCKLEWRRNDEMGRLLAGLQQMNVNLVAVMGDIRTNIDAMNTATGEIAAGNMDLSSRTEMQAASLEETASSMEEFASTIAQNADNTQQANKLVLSASAVAMRGGDMILKVGSTMDEISDSARKVTDIIAVIDSIAFQTNILALNAAVEAARAGEHGRGFAVVATEVRHLAQRSAAAAREIKGLIQNSVEKVDAGNQLVAKTKQTMDDIVGSVKQVAAIVAEIAVASKQQSVGIQQVNQAVSHMDQVTQQNATLVEEAAAASNSLHQQAEQLTHAAAVFKTEKQSAPFMPRIVHAASRPLLSRHH